MPLFTAYSGMYHASQGMPRETPGTAMGYQTNGGKGEWGDVCHLRAVLVRVCGRVRCGNGNDRSPPWQAVQNNVYVYSKMNSPGLW